MDDLPRFLPAFGGLIPRGFPCSSWAIFWKESDGQSTVAAFKQPKDGGRRMTHLLHGYWFCRNKLEKGALIPQYLGPVI